MHRMVESTLPPFDLTANNERRSAVQQAQLHITTMIDLRRVSPGGRLPSSAALAEQIGVSRPAVLQALKILADQGRVIVRPGRGGTWVAGHAADNLEARIARAWERRDTIIQMAHLREMLEPGVARMVATTGISPETLAETRRLAAAIRGSDEGNREVHRGWDTELHLLIARATGMSVIESFVTLCRREVSAALDVLPFSTEGHERSNDQHDAILDAIERRDPQAAADAAFRHVATTTSVLKGVLFGAGRHLDDSVRRLDQSVDLTHVDREISAYGAAQEGGGPAR